MIRGALYAILAALSVACVLVGIYAAVLWRRLRRLRPAQSGNAAARAGVASRLERAGWPPDAAWGIARALHPEPGTVACPDCMGRGGLTIEGENGAARRIPCASCEGEGRIRL